MSDELKVIDGGVGAPNAVLKTLDLAGFKSFVHKTHLEFAPGITAIIGPNGSGKTNLVDALRWALGENNARILRAKCGELALGRVGESAEELLADHEIDDRVTKEFEALEVCCGDVRVLVQVRAVRQRCFEQRRIPEAISGDLDVAHLLHR